MPELILPVEFIAALFFMVALAYSSVGLGGGSSYTALLALLGVGYRVIPGISLSLNIIVTLTGALNFYRKDHTRLNMILPFLITSVPMTFVGAMVPLPARGFYFLLMLSLIFVAVRIYFARELKFRFDLSEGSQIPISLVIGIVLGFLSGAVGIGGGVYLVPLIIMLGLGSEKEAAAAGSVFILINSISGLAARIQLNEIDFAAISPLIIAVFAGGFIGSYLGAGKIKPRTMQKVLGLVVITGIVFLIRKVVLP